MSATQTFEAIRAFGEHEHRDLCVGIGKVHEAANVVGVDSPVAARRSIREVVAWAATTLDPHLAWEESWLYPQIELLTRTPWSTRVARFDHGQIAAVVARLRLHDATATRSTTLATNRELRCDLFALEALLRAHIEREEKLLLPVLDEWERDLNRGL